MCSSRLLFRLSLKAESKWANEVKKQSRLTAGATLIFFKLKKSRVSELYSGWRDIIDIFSRRNARCYTNNIIATTPMFKMGCAR